MKRGLLIAGALFASLALNATPAQAIECCGRVSNDLGSATVRAYDNRINSNRTGVGLCSGGYRNVSQGTTTPLSFDADCIKMYAGSVKVTGIIEIKQALGGVVYTLNVGCNSNRLDVAVHGDETGRVKYARKCA